MKHPTTSFVNIIERLTKSKPYITFLTKSSHLFYCTGKSHYICKSSAQKKEQNQTFIPFKFQTIGNQLV